MRTKVIFLFSSLILFLLVSCGSNSSETKTDKLTGEIKIDGSSTVYPIIEAVAEEFRTVQPDVKVTIGISGTGGGFKKFGRGETDISNASRKIKASEDSICKANNIKYLELEIAYDGMAVLVNPENTWVDYLTVAELKMIWEPAAQGKIMKWNQIRKNWPDKEMHLFGPGTASGTYDYFTEAIVGKTGSSRGDFTASEDDNVLVQGIKNDVSALGFFGLAYYEENKQFLKVVPIDNGKGAVLPSIATILDNSYSPLSRPLYMYVNDNAIKRAEVVEFVNYMFENIKALTTEIGYIPLQDEKYTTEKQKFTDFVKSIK